MSERMPHNESSGIVRNVQHAATPDGLQRTSPKQTDAGKRVCPLISILSVVIIPRACRACRYQANATTSMHRS